MDERSRRRAPAATRPITDRVKESLFGILGERVPDAAVLDLYAGSGAIGIEALSRGCRIVHVRGAGPRGARRASAKPRRRPGCADRAAVVAGPVERFLAAARPRTRFDLVMVDPPFAEHAILAPLQALVPLLAPGATIVVRTFWRTPVPTPDGHRGRPAASVRRDDADLPAGRRRGGPRSAKEAMDEPDRGLSRDRSTPSRTRTSTWRAVRRASSTGWSSASSTIPPSARSSASEERVELIRACVGGPGRRR